MSDHTVELTPARLEKKVGVVVTTKGRELFIPRECLWDVSRRLSRLAEQISEHA